MSTTKNLYDATVIDTRNLRNEELLLGEAILLCFICDELLALYKTNLRENRLETETMIQRNVIQLITRDLISSNDYTITGIATYSNTPEDVIMDIAIGNNDNPSLKVSRKIIELHREARPELYQHVMHKIADHYLQYKTDG